MGWLLVALVLVAVGYGWGLLRARATSVARRERPLVLWLVYGLVGFPILVILLAKLFDSAVLGWVFGLSLLADLLLVPCALLVAIGYGLGRRFRRRSPPTIDDPLPTLSIRIDRDTVHASDDGDARTIGVDPRSTLATLLRQLRAGAWLPSISGGQATWVVTTSAPGRTPVAVIAQQWPDVRLAIADAPLGSHFAGVDAAIRFAYLAQRAPESVLVSPERSTIAEGDLVTGSRR